MADVLRGDITAGVLAPGDQLPSERVLAETHSVARNTAREAVRILTDEGLVTAVHGKGVYVRKPSVHDRLHRMVDRLTEEQAETVRAFAVRLAEPE